MGLVRIGRAYWAQRRLRWPRVELWVERAPAPGWTGRGGDGQMEVVHVPLHELLSSSLEVGSCRDAVDGMSHV